MLLDERHARPNVLPAVLDPRPRRSPAAQSDSPGDHHHEDDPDRRSRGHGDHESDRRNDRTYGDRRGRGDRRKKSHDVHDHDRRLSKTAQLHNPIKTATSMLHHVQASHDPNGNSPTSHGQGEDQHQDPNGDRGRHCFLRIRMHATSIAELSEK